MGIVSPLDETILEVASDTRQTYYGHKAKKKFPPANLIRLKSRETPVSEQIDVRMSLEKSKKILITGGARSGKSQYALNMAAPCGKRKVYLATAQPLDHEMQDRIENHRRIRGEDWITIEEPLLVYQALNKMDESCDVVILDCLTLWISNLMSNHKTDQRVIINEIKKLAQSAKEYKGTLVIVSNEVGMGIVPENKSSRQFRDLAGYANQKIAEVVDEVIMMVSGIPLKVK